MKRWILRLFGNVTVRIHVVVHIRTMGKGRPEIKVFTRSKLADQHAQAREKESSTLSVTRASVNIKIRELVAQL